eukprot:s366_g55.t1
MATAAAAPSAASAPPPKAFLAASASADSAGPAAPPAPTLAATAQPSATDSAATGAQPAQQSGPSGNTGQFSAPEPPPRVFGTPAFTCMICGQSLLASHQATSSRCRPRQGLQGPCSGRTQCPHGCGRTVAHQDPWALAQHERFCTALNRQARQPTTADPADMNDDWQDEWYYRGWGPSQDSNWQSDQRWGNRSSYWRSNNNDDDDRDYWLARGWRDC